MNDHLRSHTKAYAGAGAGFVGYQLAGDLTTLLVWLSSLWGLNIPEKVEEAIAGIFVAVLTWFAVAFTPKLEPEKLELPKP